MERSYNRRALAATAAMVGAGVLACGAVVGRYHQQTALEQFMLVPVNGPMLFSHPGGLDKHCPPCRKRRKLRARAPRPTRASAAVGDGV
jgi:hypothetical protein